MSSVYNLFAHVPYETPDCLFSGSEEGLREFVKKHRGRKSHTFYGSGKTREYDSIAGYFLSDLYVYIDGPDIIAFMEQASDKRTSS